MALLGMCMQLWMSWSYSAKNWLWRSNDISTRLDAQHLIWKLRNKSVLNPKIPVTPDMKIAEIGTGTGYVARVPVRLVPK